MAGTAVSVKRMWSLFTTSGAASRDALRALFEEHNDVITDLETLRTGMAEFVGSSTFDPGSIADGNEEATEITVTGAALGDFVTGVSFSLDLQDLELSAAVSAADTVTAVLSNNTGGAIDLGSGTLRVRVSSQGLVDAAGDLIASTLTTPESQD